MKSMRKGSASFLSSLLALFGLLLFAPVTGLAQQAPPRKAPVRKAPAKAATTPAPAQPQWKGIWEPVNYSADLQLTDIFCVSVDVCYVSGAAGTILKTTDGGQTWTPQLGGDPQSREAPIGNFRFLDETHGWALQGAGIFVYKLLRTTDGESWEQIGEIHADWGLLGYQFSSEENGVYIDGNNNVARIMYSTDGGRTWKEAFSANACRVQVTIEGLNREVACTLAGFHMASPTVGYATGSFYHAHDLLALLKTEDGGATWTLSGVEGIVPVYQYNWSQAIFFLDESTGYLFLNNKKIYATTDGGETWRGLVGTAGPKFKFADPEVGWAFAHFSYGLTYKLNYTTDGGKRWFSREFRFPAEVNGFSLPRRDRAYVVGGHGMIYRYRVVPATEEVAANVIPAPAMPVFDSPLDEQVEDLGEEVETLETELTQAAQAEGVDPNAAPAETPEQEPEEGGEEEEEASAQVTGWAKDCCGAKIQKLQTVLEAVSTEIPRFTGKYRNLNLVFSGLQTIGQFFGQAQGVKDSLRALRKARDPQSALSALTELTSQVQSLKATTKTAFQKQE